MSSADTATLGMELPAVPGPGVAGVNTSCEAAAGFTVKALELTAVVTPLMPLGVAVKV